MKFQLLVGTHVADVNGKEVIFRANNNNIIETNIDLVKRFGSDKFRRLEETGGYAQPQSVQTQAPRETLPDLDKMSANEIRKFAEDNEFDLGNARSKEEMVRAIKAQL